MNEHQKVLVSNTERHQYTTFFNFKSTDNSLLSCLICLSILCFDWSDNLSLKLPADGQKYKVDSALIWAN